MRVFSWPEARPGRRDPARGFRSGLFKNTHNLRLKLRKFHGEHVAAGMEDEIEARWKQAGVAAQSLSHAALDAVTFVRLADYLADGEADARPRRKRRIGTGRRLRGQKPAHGRGLPLTRSRVGALKVGVLAQTRSRQRLVLSWPGR